MLTQRASLAESRRTEPTFVRSFVCVDAHVVHQRALVFEHLAALVTFKGWRGRGSDRELAPHANVLLGVVLATVSDE